MVPKAHRGRVKSSICYYKLHLVRGSCTLKRVGIARRPSRLRERYEKSDYLGAVYRTSCFYVSYESKRVDVEIGSVQNNLTGTY